jgi:hypothetical protein
LQTRFVQRFDDYPFRGDGFTDTAVRENHE